MTFSVNAIQKNRRIEKKTVSLFLATTRGARMFQGIQNSSQKSLLTSPLECVKIFYVSSAPDTGRCRRAQGIQNRSQKNCLMSPLECIKKQCVQPSTGEKQQDSCPSQTKQQAEKQPTVTVGMHKNRVSSAPETGKQQREPSPRQQNRRQKNSVTSPLQYTKTMCPAQRSETAAGFVPKPNKTAVRKTDYRHLLECIKNTGIQRAKQETAGGAEPKATKPQPEKPFNVTFGMHKKLMCPARLKQKQQQDPSPRHTRPQPKNSLASPVDCVINWGAVYAKQGNSGRIRAQGMQNRRQKNSLTSLLESSSRIRAYKTVARKTL